MRTTTSSVIKNIVVETTMEHITQQTTGEFIAFFLKQQNLKILYITIFYYIVGESHQAAVAQHSHQKL
jgi:hypothetical protein